MKAQRRAAKGLAGRHVFEFARRHPKNLLRVTHNSTGVWILAARGNFSPRDKTLFVHYLVDEGFIPDQYRAFSAREEGTWAGLKWLIEEPHVGSTGPGRTHRADAFMIRLLAYGFLLWVVQIALLVTSL
jgi:hypothetical protein